MTARVWETTRGYRSRAFFAAQDGLTSRFSSEQSLPKTSTLPYPRVRKYTQINPTHSVLSPNTTKFSRNPTRAVV